MVGMKQLRHVNENLKVAEVKPLEVDELMDALSPDNKREPYHEIGINESEGLKWITIISNFNSWDWIVSLFIKSKFPFQLEYLSFEFFIPFLLGKELFLNRRLEELSEQLSTLRAFLYLGMQHACNPLTHLMGVSSIEEQFHVGCSWSESVPLVPIGLELGATHELVHHGA